MGHLTLGLAAVMGGGTGHMEFALLWAMMTDAVAVQLITSVTALATIVVTFLVNRKWKVRELRKTGRKPTRVRARPIVVAAVVFGLVVSAALWWATWREGHVPDWVGRMAVLWTAFIGIVVQVVTVTVLLKYLKTFGVYVERMSSFTDAIEEHTETVTIASRTNLHVLSEISKITRASADDLEALPFNNEERSA